MNTNNPSTEQENQEQMAELLPSVNLPMEKTIYKSSRTPLHNFILNDLVWGSRKLLQCVETKSKITSKSTPVSIPCIKAKQCKRQSSSKPVNKVVRERSVRRREALFSVSLCNEDIEQDFIRLTGKMPQRKIRVKKIYKDDEKKDFIDYQKYLKEVVPGSWMSECNDLLNIFESTASKERILLPTTL
ncbi:hypothetical protein POM88_052914 [Heracleum sosnowskyi]|uniref:Uncharacterized protein n=1 Tax=Heracleum sosnowskyi TaxID=360622 RepID=A0AAD8GR32_9APIA|nr:hypothetical protein POM88_052914 [Heracleum sosnowskyi]